MFSAGAARLAGLAGALFGWRPADFWTVTPAELASLFTAMAGEVGAGATAGADGAVLARLKEMWPDD